MIGRRTFIIGCGVALMTFGANAQEYLKPEEAARLLFPEADAFEPLNVELTKEQAKAIKKESGMRVRERKLEGFIATKGGEALGSVYVDNVIGKHEFITYAAGVSASDEVLGVEILDYRETWGFEVREKEWRVQFHGKSLADPLKLGKDIANISGATLSCRNVTDGVRRLLATHDVLNG